MENVVDKAIADKEVNDWLHYKKVPQAYIDGSPLYTNGLRISIMEGTLSIDPDTKVITHKLKFPIGEGTMQINELKYPPRLTVGKIQANISGLTDINAKTIGIIAALSGLPRTELAAMDSEDLRVASDVAAFFSP